MQYIYIHCLSKMTSFASALVSCIGVIAAGRRRPPQDHRHDGCRARGDWCLRRPVRAAGAAVPRARDAALEGHRRTAPGLVAAAKALLFAGVLEVHSTLLESRRAVGDDRDFKRLVAASAARAIFCTQSNDFALGLPVIQALRRRRGPAHGGHAILTGDQCMNQISLRSRLNHDPIGAMPALMAYAGSSPLRARTEASSPRNDLVKNYRHPTH